MAKRFRKVYLEISNICNLKCSFCPGTKRGLKAMNESEFSSLIMKLRPWTDYLYFHLMGEPLCHPQLERYLFLAAQSDFKVILTTNGTLLRRKQAVLLSAACIDRINISLHSFEANDLQRPFDEYLNDCFRFGKEAEGKMKVSYRLWNGNGKEKLNDHILEIMSLYFPRPWITERRGTRIGNGVYLGFDNQFDWPDLSAEDGGSELFCYGLRDQIGVLCDGTVVPCCLDHEGDLALGNLHEQSMEEILASERARKIYDGFSRGRAVEELCRKCGYARRFR